MDWDALEALHSDLNGAVRVFKDLYNNKSDTLPGRNNPFTDTSIPSATSPETGNEVSEACGNICGILTRLHNLFAGPSCFIYQLATNNQLLACLKWFGEFQVTGCIPLSGSVSIEELADLADVPQSILRRVIRMTATAGFLREPEPGYIAHTALSASFSTELSHFDAAMFLSNNVAPSALHLTSVTQKKGPISRSGSPWNGSNDTEKRSPHSFASTCAGSSQLSRQCSAYYHSLGGLDDSLTTLLAQWNWQSLGEASIVYICASYTESCKALLHMSEHTRLIHQVYQSNPSDVQRATLARSESGESMSQRIEVHRRRPAEPQSVKDAAVYILQPPLSPLLTNGTTSYELLTAELQAHVDVLQANPSARLIFAPTLLPEPGSVNVDAEAHARLRDFANLQLGTESALEVSELVDLVQDVCNRNGSLMVTNHLRSAEGALVGMVIQHQSFAASDELISRKDSAMNLDTFSDLLQE